MGLWTKTRNFVGAYDESTLHNVANVGLGVGQLFSKTLAIGESGEDFLTYATRLFKKGGMNAHNFAGMGAAAVDGGVKVLVTDVGDWVADGVDGLLSKVPLIGGFFGGLVGIILKLLARILAVGLGTTAQVLAQGAFEGAIKHFFPDTHVGKEYEAHRERRGHGQQSENVAAHGSAKTPEKKADATEKQDEQTKLKDGDKVSMRVSDIGHELKGAQVTSAPNQPAGKASTGEMIAQATQLLPKKVDLENASVAGRPNLPGKAPESRMVTA